MFYFLSDKQFMMMLFCKLNFCILGQTDKMATSLLAVEMERYCMRKIINDGVEASPRKSQARFQLI